jgi:tetratricopeptide (TPR) repeat protein
MSRERFLAALLCFPALAQVCPPESDTALRQINAALNGARLQDADQLLTQILGTYPDCSSVIAAQSRLELARRNYARADALSEQALRSEPKDAAALTVRGLILSMKGQPAEGRELLERAVRIDPSNSEASFQLGVIYDRAKLHPEALAMFQRTTALRPSDPRAWDYLALTLEPLGRVSDAEEAYKKGLAVNNQPVFDWFLDYNYGRLLFKLNRLPESKTHLDRALELVPSVRATHYDHAKLNLRLGNLEAARDDAEKALAIPDQSGVILDLQVYNLLATIYTRLGDKQQAQKYAELSESARIPVRSADGR